MKTLPLTKPTDTVVILKGNPAKLTWDKSAMFRAEEVGIYAKEDKGGLGLARATKYVWSMVPAAIRLKYPAPEDLALDMPPLMVVVPKIKLAIELAGDAMAPGNVFGSTNGRSQ